MNETEKIYRCTDKLEEICRLLYLKLDERARPEDAERHLLRRNFFPRAPSQGSVRGRF